MPKNPLEELKKPEEYLADAARAFKLGTSVTRNVGEEEKTRRLTESAAASLLAIALFSQQAVLDRRRDGTIL